MEGWTNKQWGALIGGIAVILVYLIGFGPAAVVAVAAIAGFYVGKYLDGELDPEEIRARAQGRSGERSHGYPEEGYTEGRSRGFGRDLR